MRRGRAQEWRVRRENGGGRVVGHDGSGEDFLVDDDYDQYDENGDNGTGYETLLVHPRIQGNLE